MTADTITANHDPDPLSDRESVEELLGRVCRQLDHLDTMIHETHQLVAELRPLVPHLPRVLALLDPMASIRGRKGRRNAVPQPEAAPVPVGTPPAHSQEMGA